jgi:hypothetical protein
MTKKFQVSLSPIRCKNENAVISIIRAVCILLNFIRKREGTLYESQFAEEEDVRELPSHIHDIVEEGLVLAERLNAQFIRGYVCNYYLKERVALP